MANNKFTGNYLEISDSISIPAKIWFGHTFQKQELNKDRSLFLSLRNVQDVVRGWQGAPRCQQPSIHSPRCSLLQGFKFTVQGSSTTFQRSRTGKGSEDKSEGAHSSLSPEEGARKLPQDSHLHATGHACLQAGSGVSLRVLTG